MTTDLGIPQLPPRDQRDPIIVSNSAIQVWRDCRRKFWLSYMRRLRPKQEKMSGALALGSRVHKALELYYIEMMKGEAVGQAHMEAIWKELVNEDRLVLEAEGRSAEDFDNEAELGRIMLEGYVEWLEDEGIDSRYEIVGLEDTLEYPMLDGQVLLVGKLDQRVRDTRDGTLLVRDHKTSASFADLEKTIEMNEQFMLYQLLETLCKENPGDRVSGTLVTGLKKVKRTASARPPFYTQLEIRHNIFTLRNFYKHLHGTLLEIVRAWRDVEDGADPHIVMFPHPTRDCSWKCLGAETEVPTRHGMAKIGELVGQRAELLIPSIRESDGLVMWWRSHWQDCEVKEFGKQALQTVELRRGRQTKTVRATPEHGWYLDDGTKVETSELLPGAKLMSSRANNGKGNLVFSPFGAAAGFTYGDGQMDRTGMASVAVYDSASSKQEMLQFFENCPVKRGTKAVGGNYSLVNGLPRAWRQLPDTNEPASYLLSWLAGYFAADGCVSTKGQATISSANRQDLDFVRLVCSLTGVMAGPVTSVSRKGTRSYETDLFTVNISRADLPDWFFLKTRDIERTTSNPVSKKKMNWTVVSISPPSAPEPVFCAVVPGIEAFSLSDDLMTANCPFAMGCPMFDNGGAVEEWLESEFEVGSPYAYYGASDPLKKQEEDK